MQDLIIFLAPIGAGKGTQAEKLKEKYGFYHLNTGDIFRKAVLNKTELGSKIKDLLDNGELVPDELVNKIVFDLLNSSLKDQKMIILDGYPRTLNQAETLDEFLKKEKDENLKAVVNLTLEDDLVIERISGRFVCVKCGETYHKLYKKPNVEGVCDECGGTDFFFRSDDKVEVLKKRLDKYHKITEPLIDFYDSKGLLKTVDGSKSLDEVEKDIEAAIFE